VDDQSDMNTLANHDMQPVVLNLDRSVEHLESATVVELFQWQEQIRFGCGLNTFGRFCTEVTAQLPEQYGTVFLGSGDYHHVTLLLMKRLAVTYTAKNPIDVVVFDNHPDNMRFPFGVHCGSWVNQVAKLSFVRHVHVVGITSTDISLAHAWENYLLPLYRKKLTYWCLDVDIAWAKYVGLGHAFRRFNNPELLVSSLIETLNSSELPIYLTIDKDVFAPQVAQTNWDQGVLLESHVTQVINALPQRVIGSDITGEISFWQYSTWWKRWLSAMDGQAPADTAQIEAWQLQHQAVNRRLLKAIQSVTKVT
jgi:hypothetical protein